MCTKKNTIGEKHNLLTITGDAESTREPSGRLVKRVNVICDCGNIKESVSYKELKRNRIKSCGCLSKAKVIEPGDVFNFWTVLERGAQIKYDRGFVCKCVCGVEREVSAGSLFSGLSKSCGCLGIPPKEKIIKEKITPIDTHEEKWKQSVSFENYYISSLGRIFSKSSEQVVVKFRNGKSIPEEMYKTFIGEYDKSIYSLQLDFKKLNIQDFYLKETKTVRYKKLKDVYDAMLVRCNNVNNKNYKSYGAKGIKVEQCFSTFDKFFNWTINNGYKEGLEIDRENPDGNYCESNCRFITKTENVLNCKNINLTLEDVHWIRSKQFSYEEALNKFTC